MAKEDEIRLIAYGLWEGEGCPNGRDCEHWLKAEAVWEENNRETPNSRAKAQMEKTSSSPPAGAPQAKKVGSPSKKRK